MSEINFENGVITKENIKKLVDWSILDAEIAIGGTEPILSLKLRHVAAEHDIILSLKPEIRTTVELKSDGTYTHIQKLLHFHIENVGERKI